MGWECEGSVMGGKRARRFVVEIEEKTKRKKQCKSEFSKCISASQSTVLSSDLSNTKHAYFEISMMQFISY